MGAILPNLWDQEERREEVQSNFSSEDDKVVTAAALGAHLKAKADR